MEVLNRTDLVMAAGMVIDTPGTLPMDSDPGRLPSRPRRKRALRRPGTPTGTINNLSHAKHDGPAWLLIGVLDSQCSQIFAATTSATRSTSSLSNCSRKSTKLVIVASSFS